MKTYIPILVTVYAIAAFALSSCSARIFDCDSALYLSNQEIKVASDALGQSASLKLSKNPLLADPACVRFDLVAKTRYATGDEGPETARTVNLYFGTDPTQILGYRSEIERLTRQWGLQAEGLDAALDELGQ
ncbi:MAG: hypothetical protein HGA85_00830 [Nanoarchaeota archaeon]|nr:hypothetical protein [Nanoarchaeota archaeon]